MQQALIHLATKGVNQREAAKLAGISEFHLSRELKKPQIQAFIARRRSEIIQIGSLESCNSSR
jgi:phage terminase small subunit